MAGDKISLVCINTYHCLLVVGWRWLFILLAQHLMSAFNLGAAAGKMCRRLLHQSLDKQQQQHKVTDRQLMYTRVGRSGHHVTRHKQLHIHRSLSIAISCRRRARIHASSSDRKHVTWTSGSSHAAAQSNDEALDVTGTAEKVGVSRTDRPPRIARKLLEWREVLWIVATLVLEDLDLSAYCKQLHYVYRHTEKHSVNCQQSSLPFC